MVDWEITATTLYCDSVEEEVTLIAYEDGRVKCTGRQKYENPDKDMGKILVEKGKSFGKQLRCNGENCVMLAQYRDRMMSEK